MASKIHLNTHTFSMMERFIQEVAKVDVGTNVTLGAFKEQANDILQKLTQGDAETVNPKFRIMDGDKK
jgi:hypothetical protein